MPRHGNVEYIADESGTAVRVKCPLVDDGIGDIDCMENQGIADAAIPERFKKKPNWKDICEQCPFRDY